MIGKFYEKEIRRNMRFSRKGRVVRCKLRHDMAMVHTLTAAVLISRKQSPDHGPQNHLSRAHRDWSSSHGTYTGLSLLLCLHSVVGCFGVFVALLAVKVGLSLTLLPACGTHSRSWAALSSFDRSICFSSCCLLLCPVWLIPLWHLSYSEGKWRSRRSWRDIK